jgi:hypothetical protein
MTKNSNEQGRGQSSAEMQRKDGDAGLFANTETDSAQKLETANLLAKTKHQAWSSETLVGPWKPVVCSTLLCNVCVKASQFTAEATRVWVLDKELRHACLLPVGVVSGACWNVCRPEPAVNGWLLSWATCVLITYVASGG